MTTPPISAPTPTPAFLFSNMTKDRKSNPLKTFAKEFDMEADASIRAYLRCIVAIPDLYESKFIRDNGPIIANVLIHIRAYRALLALVRNVSTREELACIVKSPSKDPRMMLPDRILNHERHRCEPQHFSSLFNVWRLVQWLRFTGAPCSETNRYFLERILAARSTFDAKEYASLERLVVMRRPWALAKTDSHVRLEVEVAFSNVDFQNCIAVTVAEFIAEPKQNHFIHAFDIRLAEDIEKNASRKRERSVQAGNQADRSQDVVVVAVDEERRKRARGIDVGVDGSAPDSPNGWSTDDCDCHSTGSIGVIDDDGGGGGSGFVGVVV